MVKAARSWAPIWALNVVTDRSLDIYLTTEDLPRPHNRVTVDGDKIMINWSPNNLAPHRELVKRVTARPGAGYPIILTERWASPPTLTCAVRPSPASTRPSAFSPRLPQPRRQQPLLVDACFFPSSAALNPALTIAANALRVAPTIAAGI